MIGVVSSTSLAKKVVEIKEIAVIVRDFRGFVPGSAGRDVKVFVQGSTGYYKDQHRLWFRSQE